ncbi:MULTISPECIES: glucose-1-phosphate adenylyltransferase subunit GlgD [unclassified Breznakia]|uniref:glucose-1-phosphate adenylyltransferase subunit GlgD n=1 Tax=unclassified Breznakia TaxID=2623764 RepID=UPI0024070B34|nr:MULTISPECIES: glucose-1-phosphate adenylyltransferase subunit GlgD [unclassified Breznakia]MDF9837876.1 glucose-1-phosphate adenylyltransferase [Breznakia sp. PFB2-8]MDF9859831.1 glucose-1-phosphate adenylyltransferase [Breznakia sp. PH5-24]
MCDAFGVVIFSGTNVHIDGIEDYRSIGSISFLGRYRVIDIPLSNLTNSGIETIQLYVKNNPRSIIDHVGTGRHYNINSKRGSLDILFGNGKSLSEFYRSDIATFDYNRSAIENMSQKYVVVAANFMLYSIDYNDVIEEHIKTGADVTVLYKNVDNAKEAFINCDVLNLNKQKGVLSIDRNRGNFKNKNISMESYVMSKEIFLAMVDQAVNTSSLYWMRDILNDASTYLDIRGYQYKGYLAAINSFASYYRCNMELLNPRNRSRLFKEDWPIYTKTNDSSPTHYFSTGSATNSLVSNGCCIEGRVENSVIGRGCNIKKGAIVKNSIIFPGSVVGEDVSVNYTVIDKKVIISKVKEVNGTLDQPAYVKRDDRI